MNILFELWGEPLAKGQNVDQADHPVKSGYIINDPYHLCSIPTLKANNQQNRYKKIDN